MRLDVPLKVTAKDGFCVPACVEMVLLFLQNLYGPTIKSLSQLDIGKSCGTTEDGTVYEAWEQLNKSTSRFVPSVEFELKSNQEIKDIVKELGKNLPAIILMEMEDPEEKERFPHAVVATGIDNSRRMVIFNDPMGGKDREMEMGKFRSLWAKDYCAWYIRIGLQRKLVGDEE